MDMDYDTSTICKIRSEVNPVIEKCSDKSHTLKNFTNHLFTLPKNKYRRILSTKVINHIRNVLQMLFHPAEKIHSPFDLTWMPYLTIYLVIIFSAIPHGLFIYRSKIHMFLRIYPMENTSRIRNAIMTFWNYSNCMQNKVKNSLH